MSDQLHETLSLDRVAARLQQLVDVLRKGEEWGGLGDPEQISWAVNATGEYAYDGVFVSIGVWNLGAGVISVAFTPNGARNSPLFTVSGRSFIVLPYRGTTVSLYGAAGAAGSALVTPFEIPQPANGGTF